MSVRIEMLVTQKLEIWISVSQCLLIPTNNLSILLLSALVVNFTLSKGLEREKVKIWDSHYLSRE